jgi:actin-related protein 8
MANLSASYVLRRPILGPTFNTRDYPASSRQMLSADLEALVLHGVLDMLNIDKKNIPDHAVVLIVPDFWRRTWVKEWVQLLLVTMGFAKVCVQQVGRSSFSWVGR